jgi:hypothetical protein
MRDLTSTRLQAVKMEASMAGSAPSRTSRKEREESLQLTSVLRREMRCLALGNVMGLAAQRARRTAIGTAGQFPGQSPEHTPNAVHRAGQCMRWPSRKWAQTPVSRAVGRLRNPAGDGLPGSCSDSVSPHRRAFVFGRSTIRPSTWCCTVCTTAPNIARDALGEVRAVSSETDNGADREVDIRM